MKTTLTRATQTPRAGLPYWATKKSGPVRRLCSRETRQISGPRKYEKMYASGP